MYFTSKKLSNDLIEALKKAEVVFNTTKDRYEVEIPELDRQDYEAFKQVLEEIHGKWNRSAQAHVFDHDPTKMLERVIEVGCFPQRKPHEAFFTPRPVTEMMVEWGGFHYNHELFSDWRYLEPSAGQGFILDVLRELYPGIEEVFDCFEIDPFNKSVLQKKGYRVIGDDFLTADSEPVYDYIIMNPPFNGRAGDYVEHIEKAFSLLAPKGELVAIVPFSFLTSTTKRVEDFRNKVFTYGEHAELGDDSFKESGTNMKCVMIRMTKFSDERVRELENGKTYYGAWDIYAGSIVVTLQSDTDWYYPMEQLVDRIKAGRSTSETVFLTALDSLCDRIVRQKIWKEECSFRWDTLIRERVVRYFFESIIEDYFDDVNPFTSQKPRQLSLFG